LPEHMPEDLPDRMPDRMSEDMPEDMPDRVPEDMPEHIAEDMAGRMPEDMPVTKRIYVMVGITRSKVFVFFDVAWVRAIQEIKPQTFEVGRSHPNPHGFLVNLHPRNLV